MKGILSRDFLALILSVAVVGLGLGATLPLTALALVQAGYGTDIVGLMTAMQAGGGLAVAPFASRVAARCGARETIVGTVIVAALSTIAMQFTVDLWLWAVLRFLCGAALMLLFTIGEAWVTQLADDSTRGRVVAIYATNFTLFQMTGPVLVSVIGGLQSMRFAICGAIFLLALPVLASIRGTPQSLASGERRRRTWRLAAGAAAHAGARDRHGLFRALRYARALADAALRDVARHWRGCRRAVRIGDPARRHDDAVSHWLARGSHRAREACMSGAGVVVVVLLPLLPWAMSHPWICWPLLYRDRRGGGQHLYAVDRRVRRTLSRSDARVGDGDRRRIVERGELRRADDRRDADAARRRGCADWCVDGGRGCVSGRGLVGVARRRGSFFAVGVGVVWDAKVFRRIPVSCRSISSAPVRGGTHFLCCCKESNCIEGQGREQKKVMVLADSRSWHRAPSR